MVERYKEQFNNIIYIKIANKIQDDFISQINATLKLPFKDKNTDVKFRQIISYIEKYYKEGNNLLILDIDNTADKEDISLCINANNLFITNKLFLSNWRVLILSSEKFGVFQSVLLDNQDKEFLKKIFLRKTGERYEQFEHFDDLFKLVNYNTLLTEQLAFYLKSLPIQSLDEIKNIVYKYSFDKKTDGINAQDREKINVRFLKDLVKMQDITTNEQKLLRHFVLWKSEFIQYDIIEDLLRDVCEDLEETLSERSILNFDEVKSAYKLHGLLADSLREQIDVAKQDYETYFDNIDRIRDYNFREFLPYADCIGNSLCEYDITTDVEFLNDMAIKFYETLKTDYAKELYDKCIKISNQRLETEPENIEWLEYLSNSYNNLAVLHGNRLNNYELAEKNCYKAIEIAKGIIKISTTPKYLNLLATRYNNLALLQDEQLNDPKSAENNYNEAIKIREKITQQSDDPEYLNYLAGTYYNLATLQTARLNDSASAEDNYNKAIEIGERIRKTDNPKADYLYQLAKAYGDLAVMQKNRKDYDAAKRNLEEAIKIGDSIKYENIQYLVDWLLSKRNYADILIATGNPNAARGIINDIKQIAEEWVEKIPNYGDLKRVYGAIKDTESYLNQ